MRARRTSPPTATSSTISSRTSTRRPITARRGRRITTGIPDGAYTRTIREDPVRRGLLYAGTETGIYYSTDDGAHWQSLQLNLPRASVRDLDDPRERSHRRDARPSDVGRSTTSRRSASLATACATRAVHLFAPDTAIRFAGGSRAHARVGGREPAGGSDRRLLAQELRCRAHDSVQARVSRRDRQSDSPVFERAAAGFDEVRGADANALADSSACNADQESREASPATRCRTSRAASREVEDDTLAFVPSDSIVTVRAGLNRFVWDLHYPDTKQVKDVVNDEGSTRGPFVSPGTYTVRLTAHGQTLTQPFVVRGDPRSHDDASRIRRAARAALQVQTKTNELSDAVKRILDSRTCARRRVATMRRASHMRSASPTPLSRFTTTLEAIRDSLVEIHSHADEITLHYPIRYYNMLLSLAGMVQSADAGTDGTRKERSIATSRRRSITQLAQTSRIESTDIASFNALMKELNVPAVMVHAAPHRAVTTASTNARRHHHSPGRAGRARGPRASDAGARPITKSSFASTRRR